MALRYPSEWKFAGPDEIPALGPGVAGHFHDLLLEISGTADDSWDQLERFKRRFGASVSSTSSSWAESDLLSAMQSRTDNTVKFIDALWMALGDAEGRGLAVPSARQLNARFREYGVPYQIVGDELQQVQMDASVVTLASSAPKGLDISYQIGDVIGKGGFGVVHRATRQTSVASFEFALKILDPIVSNEKAVPRFQREVRAIQSLQHRAVIPYVDAGIDARGRPFLVMPLVAGPNIRDATDSATPTEVIALIVEVLSGIGHAHANKVLHRDLKPSNILVRTSDNQPVILDFGTAFIFDDEDNQTLTSTAVGSMGYIPPEVLVDRSIRSQAQDLYACAVIAYELLARRRPNTQVYQPLANEREGMTKIDSVLAQALGPLPGRFDSAKLLSEALQRAIAHHR